MINDYVALFIMVCSIETEKMSEKPKNFSLKTSGSNNDIIQLFFTDQIEIKSLLQFFDYLKKSNFFQNIGAKQFFSFSIKIRFCIMVFFLFVGRTITISGWSQKIAKQLQAEINFYFFSLDQNRKAYILDCTYSKVKNPRRLGTLGGGIRRIFSIIKENSKNKNNKLTNKQIIENLKHYTILGSEDELIRTIDAVERNKKLPNEIKEYFLNYSIVPFDKSFTIIRKIVISLTVIRLVYVIEYTIHILQEKVERPAVDSLCYNFINELKSLLNLGDSEQYKSSINNL